MQNVTASLSALRRRLMESPNYLAHVSAHKLLLKLKESPGFDRNLQPARIAVLGSSTTAQLIPLLELHSIKEGILPEIYEAGFDQYQQEILSPDSGLYAFKPQIALLFVNYRDAERGYTLGATGREHDLSRGARPRAAEEEVARWESLWKTLRERASCAVIMNNFDLPVERPLGNLEAKRQETGIGYLRRLNALLAERAPSGVVILDQEHLSAVLGKERWHDPRFWYHSKQAISFDGLVLYAGEAAALIKAVLGRSRKCLVLDLDNTLWGGIVGEDGVDALEIGDTPAGESFVDFQKYLKALKNRGVLLAVCSKNELDNAREPFLRRSEMILRLEDFAAFVANWKDKAGNLKAIADSLNLGMDALAFIDDSPEERELVRSFCPEVAVVDLPEDPAEFRRRLDSLRLFEAVSISAEDAARTAHFKAEEARVRMQKSATDMDRFLKDLEMKASVGPFQEKDLDRIVQLINKTNQFNLTTRRYTEVGVRALLKDPAAITLAIRLKDRFGDYGLISVCIGRILTTIGETATASSAGRKKETILEIDTWLMSCRVLSRGVERLAFNRLLEIGQAKKAKALIGRYIPSPKNMLVKDLYKNFGFKETKDGRWRGEVKDAKPLKHFIQED